MAKRFYGFHHTTLEDIKSVKQGDVLLDGLKILGVVADIMGPGCFQLSSGSIYELEVGEGWRCLQPGFKIDTTPKFDDFWYSEVYVGGFENPKLQLGGNLWEMLGVLLKEHGHTHESLKLMTDRHNNFKITTVKDRLDENYVFSTKLEESTYGGYLDRNYSEDEISQMERYNVVSPNLLFVLHDNSFIDFNVISRADYDGGHTTFHLRFNDINKVIQ